MLAGIRKKLYLCGIKVKQLNSTIMKEFLKEMKGASKCAYGVVFAVLMVLVVKGTNPYLNMLIIPFTFVLAVGFIAWVQETEFKCRNKVSRWFFGTR